MVVVIKHLLEHLLNLGVVSVILLCDWITPHHWAFSYNSAPPSVLFLIWSNMVDPVRQDFENRTPSR